MPRDWRNSADYADLEALDLSCLAWEFLRRNPHYPEAFSTGLAEAVARFGLRFPADPAQGAVEAPVFWRAEAAPAHVVQLARAALGGLGRAELEPLTLAERVAEEGLHLRLRDGLQVVLPQGAESGLGALVALDAHYRARLAAVGALARLVGAHPPSPDPLSILGRGRVVLMIRALDAQARRASYREIASALLRANPTGSNAWRPSAARGVVIRLCRSARQAALGGYRRFLALKR